MRTTDPIASYTRLAARRVIGVVGDVGDDGRSGLALKAVVATLARISIGEAEKGK